MLCMDFVKVVRLFLLIEVTCPPVGGADAETSHPAGQHLVAAAVVSVESHWVVVLRVAVPVVPAVAVVGQQGGLRGGRGLAATVATVAATDWTETLRGREKAPFIKTSAVNCCATQSLKNWPVLVCTGL